VISGKAIDAAAGQVALWQRLPGQPGFQIVANGTTIAGQYEIARAAGLVQTNRKWYVTAGGVQSPTIEQSVRAEVTLSSSITAHVAVILSGGVTPRHAHEQVLLEASHGGAWRVFARPRLIRASRYAVAAPFVGHRSVDVRTVFPGDQRNVRSYSPVIAIAAAP